MSQAEAKLRNYLLKYYTNEKYLGRYIEDLLPIVIGNKPPMTGFQKDFITQYNKHLSKQNTNH